MINNWKVDIQKVDTHKAYMVNKQKVDNQKVDIRKVKGHIINTRRLIAYVVNSQKVESLYGHQSEGRQVIRSLIRRSAAHMIDIQKVNTQKVDIQKVESQLIWSIFKR